MGPFLLGGPEVGQDLAVAIETTVERPVMVITGERDVMVGAAGNNDPVAMIDAKCVDVFILGEPEIGRHGPIAPETGVQVPVYRVARHRKISADRATDHDPVGVVNGHGCDPSAARIREIGQDLTVTMERCVEASIVVVPRQSKIFQLPAPPNKDQLPIRTRHPNPSK